MRNFILKIIGILSFVLLFMFPLEAKENSKIGEVNKRPKVSIIVPVYNTASWLKECLDSLRGQSLKEIEIICIDDGSTDDSGKILDEYASEDSRIIVIHKENGGLSSARNAGLDVCNGEYITFVDSDDYVHPLTYEYSYKYAKEDDVDVLHFKSRRFKDGHDNFDVNNIDLSDSDVVNAVDYFKAVVPHHVWNHVFKYNLIHDDNLRFVDNSKIFAEDTCFNMMAVAKANKVKSILGKFYNYRLNRPGQLVRSMSGKEMYKRILNIPKYVIDNYTKRNCIQERGHYLLSMLTNWIFGNWRSMSSKYPQEALNSLGILYNQKFIEKCSKNVQEMIRKFEKISEKQNKKVA